MTLTGTKWALVAAGVAVLLCGCVGHTATPAAHGKAYVVIGNVFGSDTYFCEAKAAGRDEWLETADDGGVGQPECWQVIEQEVRDK